MDEGISTNSIDVTIPASDAVLYRIADDIAEYIPDVNAMAASGMRMFFAHQRGLALVDYGTGFRRNVHDGTAYTAELDVAVTGNAVYVAQSAPDTGNVVRWDRNLLAPAVGFWAYGTGPVTSVAVGGGRVLVGASRSNQPGWVYRSDTTLTARDSVRVPDGVNDVKYQPFGDAMVVATRRGIVRRSCATFDSLAWWQDGTANTPVVRIAVDTTGVIAALDNGSAGNVQTIAPDLVSNQGGWTDGGAFPRVVDVVATPDGADVLAAVPRTNLNKFSSLLRSGMSEQWSSSATSPRAVAYLGNLDAFMATPAGVLRRSDTGTMYSRYTPNPSDRNDGPLPASFAFELMPNVVQAHSGTAQLWIDARFVGASRWAVFDLGGRRVQSGRWDPSTEPRRVLELQAIRAGIYFLRLERRGALATRRFVVLK